MSQLPIDFEAARAARDSGIQRAADHADSDTPGWGEVALSFLERYARENEQFISEECTQVADRLGYGSPTDSRAWGAVFLKASRKGLIERIGYGVSKRRHLSPTPLWRSRICVKAAA